MAVLMHLLVGIERMDITWQHPAEVATTLALGTAVDTPLPLFSGLSALSTSAENVPGMLPLCPLCFLSTQDNLFRLEF